MSFNIILIYLYNDILKFLFLFPLMKYPTDVTDVVSGMVCPLLYLPHEISIGTFMSTYTHLFVFIVGNWLYKADSSACNIHWG